MRTAISWRALTSLDNEGVRSPDWMSATDAVAGGIIAIASAAATVLLTDWVQGKRTSKEDERKLQVLAHDTNRLFGDYVIYLVAQN